MIMHNKPDNELPDEEETGVPLDAGDSWGSGTWGSVDANGERRIHGRVISYGTEPDVQGEVFPSDSYLESIRHQQEVEKGIAHFTNEFFMNSAVPPGLLKKEFPLYTRREAFVRFVLFLILGLALGWLGGEFLRWIQR
jgi:hypothetical protein